MIYVVSGSTFTKAYSTATVEEQAQVDVMIETSNREALDKWLKNYTEPSIRELRVRAASLQVPRYSRMDKATLLKEIQNANSG